MQVHLVTPHLLADDPLSQRVIAQWRAFREQGDDVVIESAQAPLGVDAEVAAATVRSDAAGALQSDLTVLHVAQPYAQLARAQEIERGAAILYLHPIAQPTTSEGRDLLNRVAAAVDLIVLEGAPGLPNLADRVDVATTPVRTLDVNAATTPVDYAVRWAEMVAEATAWLPNRPYPYGHLPALAELHPPPSEQAARPKKAATAKASAPRDWLDSAALDADMQQLATDAGIMQHDYVVRSRFPLLGPLLAWARRNLTSHLREPYIDPTFQRQEDFNRQLIRTLTTMAADQAALAQQVQALSEQLAHERNNQQANTAAAATDHPTTKTEG